MSATRQIVLDYIDACTHLQRRNCSPLACTQSLRDETHARAAKPCGLKASDRRVGEHASVFVRSNGGNSLRPALKPTSASGATLDFATCATSVRVYFEASTFSKLLLRLLCGSLSCCRALESVGTVRERLCKVRDWLENPLNAPRRRFCGRTSYRAAEST